MPHLIQELLLALLRGRTGSALEIILKLCWSLAGLRRDPWKQRLHISVDALLNPLNALELFRRRVWILLKLSQFVLRIGNMAAQDSLSA